MANIHSNKLGFLIDFIFNDAADDDDNVDDYDWNIIKRE